MENKNPDEPTQDTPSSTPHVPISVRRRDHPLPTLLTDDFRTYLRLQSEMVGLLRDNPALAQYVEEFKTKNPDVSPTFPR